MYTISLVAIDKSMCYEARFASVTFENFQFLEILLIQNADNKFWAEILLS